MCADRDQVLLPERLLPLLFLCLAICRVFAVSKQETSKQGEKEVNSFWACRKGGESDVKGGPLASNWKGKKITAVPTIWVLSSSSGREEHEFSQYKEKMPKFAFICNSSCPGSEVHLKGLKSATDDVKLVGAGCRAKAETQWFWRREGIT